MKTTIIKALLILSVLLIGGFTIYHAFADSEVEKVSKELIEKRVEWNIKENTIVELKKQLENYTKEKLALEPQIRELQSQLDTLVGKK